VANVGRPPAIEGHPKRDEILRAILQPGANRSEIQRRFKVSATALDTFSAKHVTEAMQKAIDTVAQIQADTPVTTMDVMAKLALLADRGYRMLSAADAWLEDPNAPGHYNLNPRTHEVDVVWEREIPIGEDRYRIERKTEKLSNLLRDVEEGLGITVVRGETKTADPRRLLLEAVATLKPVVELIGKATGQIRPDPAPTVNVLVTSPDWLAMRERIATALVPYPEALAAVREAIAGE